jgi:hypothetical protein
MRRRIRILRHLPGWMIAHDGEAPDVFGDSVHRVSRSGPVRRLLPDCRVHVTAITAVAVSTSHLARDLTVRAPVSESRKEKPAERLAHVAGVVHAAIDACRHIVEGRPIIDADRMEGAIREHCRVLHRTFCEGSESHTRLSIASPWRQTLGILPSDDAKIVYGDLAHPLGDERIPVLDVSFTPHEIVLHEVAASLRPEHDDPMIRLRDAAAHAHLRDLVSPTPPARVE